MACQNTHHRRPYAFPQLSLSNIPDENPAAWAPAELEEHRPQIDAGHGKDAEPGDLAFVSTWSRKAGSWARWTYRGPLDGRLHAPIDADDEHDDRLSRASPEQTHPPAKRVCGEEQEAETAHHFNNAVHACREEGHKVAAQTEGLENLGRVVVLKM